MNTKWLLVGGVLVVGALYLASRPGPRRKLLSLDEVAAIYEAGCDQLILEGSKQSAGHTYTGGQCSLSLSPDQRSALATVELYFQDAAGTWKKQSTQERLPASRLTTEARAELRRRGAVLFDVGAPQVVAVGDGKG